MTIQGQILYKGYFISDGNPRIIDFPGDVTNYFQMNWTQWNSTETPGVLKRAWFHDSMPNDSYLGVKNTDGAATDESIRAIINGFSRIDFRNPPTYTATAVTAITQASPAQVTSAAHGLQVNDLVILTNITGMQQLSSLPFEVLAVIDANNFTISIDTSGFAAPGTGGTVVKIFDDQFYRPQRRFITGVTQGIQTIIHHSIHIPGEEYVGEKYRFIVPPQFGMTELNGRIGEIVAINDAANTITVDIDSTGFTAFTWPASAAVPFTFAHYIPVGEISSVLTGAVHSRAFRGLQLGTDVVGAADDHIKWWACKGELINLYR